MDLIGMAKGAKGGGTDKYSELIRSGQLQKALLKAYKEPGGGDLTNLDVEFFLNPKSIQVVKSVSLESPQTEGHTKETRWKSTDPIRLTLGELWFDTYEERASVRARYIDRLEKLLQYVDDTHHIPCVRFVWGQFTQGTDQDPGYNFSVEKLSVDYTMFLPDGTPVRAKVQLDLKQCQVIEDEGKRKPKQSPDHAKLYTVRRGDTLQGIATAEYDDPREWRRIADTNGIDDPMRLQPGIKLLVPPIIK
jgi:hypothetical protein